MSGRRWPLGICELAWPELDRTEGATRAAAAGFDHLDVIRRVDPAEVLALPVAVRFGRGPGYGWAWPAPPAGADRARAIAALAAADEPRVEPWCGSLFGSDAELAALVAEVPTVRLVVDVGHVAQWGGDPLAFLDRADHVQLRQAAPGHGQLAPEDGVVDFAALFRRLEALDYRGVLSVEYFDVPAMGWAHPDPFGACVALAEHVAPLLAGTPAGRA